MASEVCFNRLNLKARVVVCGNMSSYEGVGDPKVSIALGNLVPTRGRVEGFLVFDYQAGFTEARKKMIEWVYVILVGAVT
jgi:NADPH-dependent curcumin reductase CurA